VTFNKTEVKQLLEAVAEAIGSYKELIAANCTEFQDVPDGYLLPKVPAKCDLRFIAELKLQIKQWRELRVKIMEHEED